MTVVKAELGTKRTCPSCAARFYDLMKDPVKCPACGVTFIPEVLLPSKTELPAQEEAKPKPAEAPKPAKKDEADDEAEVVSLNDLDEDGDDIDDDDETAGIEDVEIDDDAKSLGDDDDTFLEEDDEDDDAVPGIVVTPGAGDDEV